MQIGLTHYRLRSGRSQGWAHRHGLVEEIYVVLSGNGRIKVDEDCFELQPLDAVRVAPGSAREMQAGGTGSKCSPSGRMSRAMARWSAIGLRHE